MSQFFGVASVQLIIFADGCVLRTFIRQSSFSAKQFDKDQVIEAKLQFSMSQN